MNRYVVILAVLLIAATANAGQYIVTSLPTTITQSAHSADTWDTVTMAGTRLTSTGSGVTFAAGCNHWVFNLGSDTLEYGTDSTETYPIGINLASNSYETTDIIILGNNQAGLIYHNPAHITGLEGAGELVLGDMTMQTVGINLGVRVNGIEIRGITVRVTGAGAWTHCINGEARGHKVVNCKLINDAYAFIDRQLFQTSCITSRQQYDSFAINLGYDYGWLVDSCELESNSGTSIYFTTQDSAVFRVERSTFTQDTRNIYGVDYPGAYRSTTNVDFAIWAQGWGPGSYVRDCDFYAGDTYNGGRGLMVYFCEGRDGTPLRFSNLRCHRMHEGTNSEYQSIWNPEFIKIRGGTKWCEFDSIYGAWLIDTIETQYGGYCPRGGMIMYEYWNDYTASPHNVSFKNSACSTLAVTNTNYTNYSGWVITWEDIEDADTSSYTQNNYLYSNATTIYDFGHYDGNGAYARFIGDTVNLVLNTDMPRQYTFNQGYYADPSLGNVARDLYYVGEAAPGDIGYWTYGGSVSGEKTLRFQRTLNLYVRGTNGLPVTEATVSATNNYGTVALSGTSDSHGFVSGVVSYGWYARTATDSTSFNNFTLNASKAGDNTNVSFTVAWDNYIDTLDLTATVGDGTWSGETPTNEVRIRSGIIRSGVIR